MIGKLVVTMKHTKVVCSSGLDKRRSIDRGGAWPSEVRFCDINCVRLM